MQPVILETPRLVAVMWEPDDAGLIQELHSTIETTQYLSGAAAWSREKSEERLRNWFGEQARDGDYEIQDPRPRGRSLHWPRGLLAFRR